MSDPSQLAISVRGLTRDYGDRPALDGVDLELRTGATLALFGPNGSGKSTLLRVLAGLLRPGRGEVSVFGCALPREVFKLRGRIGYLGHEPLLYEDLTGRENLEFQARMHGIPPAEAAARIEADLAVVGMTHRSRDRVADYSAGMRQRMAICRTVLPRPELLLLDEPDSNLDPEGRAEVRALIGRPEDLSWSSGSPISRVVVSHEPDRARAEADQVLELTRHGRTAPLAGGKAGAATSGRDSG
ncbi:MAG: ABC transporter ATP-binding protein [Solirubrobacterales bacterium]|nr:ABC transporter ATP-binding protein [Solirubrobacterales bacterium]